METSKGSLMRRVPIKRRTVTGCMTALAILFLGSEADAALLDPPESSWILYSTPSPSGSAEVLKQYPPKRREFDLSVMIDARTTRSRIVPIVPGVYPPGPTGDDGVVVGWSGDNHLTVGWPVGKMVLAGPAAVDGIDISYVNYELDLTKAAPSRVDEITLHNVQYTFKETESYSNVNCAIRMTGKDGKIFDSVTLEVVGHGIGRQRISGFETGAISVEFALTRLPDARSPPLTPTQAKIGDIYPYNSRFRLSGAPVQSGMALRYGSFLPQTTPELFKLLRNGEYRIRYSLTFGERVVVYTVNEPITKDVAHGYQQCDARTTIFKTPLGGLLK